MKEIHFIQNLSFSPDGKLTAISGNGRSDELFMRQGVLDGACAVYSLMMMLIIHRRITRSSLLKREKGRGYSSIMRLQDTFIGKLPGAYQDGYYFNDMCQSLQSCFKKVATATCFMSFSDDKPSSREQLHSILQKTIDNGYPVQIGFSRKGQNGGGHAVVAIGYQEFWNGGDKLHIFCLDPGFELPNQAFWNTIIEIDLDGGNRAIYRDYNYSENRWITVNEILTIDEPDTDTDPF